MNGKPPDSVSLYWHIPFCTQKCGYCHFYVLPNKESLKDELLQGLLLEFESVFPRISESNIPSIYFGGGTPALFGPERLEKLLQWQRRLKLTSDCEITLEANPEELTVELLEAYRAIGINRLSIGVQSLNDSLLTTLTRRHSAQKAIDMVQAANRIGFDNITIDLMYDVPGQTLDQWKDTLYCAVELPITHLSLYNLTIEPHTQFFKNQAQLKPLIPDDTISQAMYEAAVETLNAAGLHQYEVSAFAKSGFPSRHNSGYWTGRAFHGFGPSAFSYWKGCRFQNVSNQKRYVEALNANQSSVDFEETLTPDAQERELFVIRLRLVEGLDLNHFSIDSSTLSSLQELIKHGYLLREGDVVKLTHRGRLCYDSVATELV